MLRASDVWECSQRLRDAAQNLQGLTPAIGWPTVSERNLVEAGLDDFFRLGRSKAVRYGPDFEQLWELAGSTARGGKLVRPLLLLGLHRALSRSCEDSGGVAMELAVALELLHYAFLLHDDVIDEDMTRRGAPNLIGQLLQTPLKSGTSRTLRWAQTGGILMGDLLLAGSHQIFARAQLPEDQRRRLLDLLDHTVTESVAGEFSDVGLAEGVTAPDLGTVLAMTGHKTATYTFELPMRMAAVLGSAPEHIEDKLGTIGGHLGLAFQLQDDLLCAFGDPACHGKDEFSDLREAKQTAIIAFARLTDAWPRIEAALAGGNLTRSQARSLSLLLNDCGARQFVESLVETHLNSARYLISDTQPELPKQVRLVLTGLIGQLDGRRS